MAEAEEKTELTYKKPKAAAWEGAFEAFRVAFDRIKQNPAPAFLFAGTYLLLSILSLAVQPDRLSADTRYASFESLTYLIFLLAMPVYALALADGKKISLSEFMSFNFRKWVYLLITGILAAIIIGASALLLIFPIIWTVAWFYFQSLVIADKSLNPIEALKESKRLAQNHKGKVWGIIGVSILVGILASLVAVILPIIGLAVATLAGVWTVGAGAILYRWLQKNN